MGSYKFVSFSNFCSNNSSKKKDKFYKFLTSFIHLQCGD